MKHCQCNECGWTSYSKSELKDHFIAVHKENIFSFVLAFSTFIKRTKIFVFHSSFIRKNGKKCPSLREKSFCFSKNFFPTLKEKSFCLAKAFFLWQKDFSFRVGKKFLPKLKILWFGEKSNKIFSWGKVQKHLGYFSKKLNICWKYSKLFQSIKAWWNLRKSQTNEKNILFQ